MKVFNKFYCDICGIEIPNGFATPCPECKRAEYAAKIPSYKTKYDKFKASHEKLKASHEELVKRIENAELSQSIWEDNEHIVLFNGKPIGATITRHHREFDRWWPSVKKMLLTGNE